MTVTREMWYEWIAKSRGEKPKDPLYYKINEVSDPTSYELDLGSGKKFVFNKKSGTVLIGTEKRNVALNLGNLKKMFDFAKKNKAI